MNSFSKLVRFDADDAAGDTVETPPQAGGKEKWTPEQQQEFDKRAAALRKAAIDEGRKKAQAEFEAKQQAEKDAADKARLEEQGQFKEVSAKAETAKAQAEQRAQAAEARAKNLELQMSFDRSVRSLKIEFANEQAESDAFEHLDRELVGEDGSGMKKAIEQLQKDRPYYFGESTPTANTDATKNGKRQTTQKGDEETKRKELVQRFNIRRPR